jgi:hypothetical protein
MNTITNNAAPFQNEQKISKRDLFNLAWQFVKRNGLNFSQALKTAWANFKLKLAMKVRIVKFYYQKTNGEIREAFGTLCSDLVPAIAGTDTRKKCDTIQTYYDSEKQEWRCYKLANLIINL